MATSSTVTFYTGYYTGGKPTVLSANPFDVAQDLSTGNLWQYTGGAWVAPSWQTSITFWLGAADSVCARLNSPDTKIPDTIQVYYGTDDQVPPELNLSAEDVAIHHGVGNYNLHVNVLRQDVTTDTVVDVPFPEGYIISTDDGNWTILKNFTQCVGYDYATVSLAWTTTADGQGPQSVNYVTSAEARDIAEEVVSSGGVAVDIEGGNGINVVTSGGSSVVELATSASFDESFTIVASDPDLGSASFNINTQGIYLWCNAATLFLDPYECMLNCRLIVSSSITLNPADGFSNPVSLTTSAGALLVDDQPLATKGYVDSAIGGVSVDIEGGNGINVITSGGSSVVELSGSASFDSATVAVENASIALANMRVDIHGDDGVYLSDIFPATLSVRDGGIYLDAFQPELEQEPGRIHLTEYGTEIYGETVTINSQTVATEPWVSNAITGLVNVSTVADIANNAAVSIVKSGGAEQELSQITAWFGSGYVVYEDIEPETVIGYKPIVLSRVGSEYVRNFTDEVWASASDTQIILNGSVTCTNISGALVMEAAIGQDVYIGGVQPEPALPVFGTIASSTDGGYTWELSQSGTYAGLSWCAYDYETYAQGAGVCTSITTLRAPGATVSGALVSNSEISTVVGGYRLTYTASGGLLVSGSDVSGVFSDGQIVASTIADPDAGNGASVVLSGYQIVASTIADPDGPNENARLTLSPGAVTIRGAQDGLDSSCELAVSPGGATIGGETVATEPWADSRFARQLVTSTDVGAATAYISVLSGGTSYVFTDPADSLIVDSVVKTTEASFIHFTLDSVTAPTPVAISGYTFASGRFEGGKEYLVGFFDGMCAVNEVTSGGVLQ